MTEQQEPRVEKIVKLLVDVIETFNDIMHKARNRLIDAGIIKEHPYKYTTVNDRQPSNSVFGNTGDHNIHRPARTTPLPPSLSADEFANLLNSPYSGPKPKSIVSPSSKLPEVDDAWAAIERASKRD